MNSDTIINRLSDYTEQLAKLEGQFQKTQEGLFLSEGSDFHLDRIVRELQDLYHDALGKNQYSVDIERIYRSGRANYFDSSSLKSVQEIRSLILASITRFQNNPSILEKKEASTIEPSKTPVEDSVRNTRGAKGKLELPEVVTLRWLYEHVPYRLWYSAVGLLLTVFLVGIGVAKIPIIQTLIGITCDSAT